MILADGDWTWSELAFEIAETHTKEDLEELIYFLKEMIKHKDGEE